MSMESPSSSSGGQHPHLPPGFRFHPTDEELVVHYLKKKVDAVPLPVTIIAEIDLYKYDPWELPSKASFGEHEWYFFTPRDRKYPNGARPNRAATSGYWKATGTDKPIHTGNGTQKVAVKKALVFYGGKPPRGVKTNWIMHEYRLLSSNSSSNTKLSGSINALNNKGSLRLDDWVLCRIFKKTTPSNRALDHNEREESMDEMLVSTPNSSVDGYPHPVLQCSENPESFFPRMISGNESGAQFHQSQYWDNLPMNNGLMLSTKQWQGGSDGDDNNNNNNKSNSFISILNQNSQSNAPFINHNSLDNSIGDDDGFLYKFPSFSK